MFPWSNFLGPLNTFVSYGSSRHLALVGRAFVHGAQEVVEAFTERVVAFRAAHAADLFEL